MTDNTSVEQSESQRTITGTVIGDKMDKTIVVQIERKVKHALYGKYVRRFSKMYAHDEQNTCRIGDVVVIKQTRPLSKTKRWAVIEVVKKQEQE